MINAKELEEAIRLARKVEGKINGKLFWHKAQIRQVNQDAVSVEMPFTIMDRDFYERHTGMFKKDMWESIDCILRRKKLAFGDGSKVSAMNYFMDEGGTNWVKFIISGLSEAEIIMYAAHGFKLMVERKKKE